jgi:ribosomal peptide maturation radical SAM protein 1
VDWSQYTVIGFTSTFAQSLASLYLAKQLKGLYPSIKIVFGGANLDSEMGVEFIRAFEWVDYAVHGEAEESFPWLLRNIAEGRAEDPVPGITMRSGGQLIRGDQNAPPPVNLNDNPIPDYDTYVQELSKAGFGGKLALNLYYESSRGCWWGAKHHCTFCGLNGSTMAFRAKTAQRTFDEIVTLSKKYRCLTLCAADNILAMDSFHNLLPMLAELESDISLFYEIKANLSKNHLRMLRKSGVTVIQPGIESFSTRLLGLMNKGVTGIQNIQFIKWCQELGVDPLYNVLFGFPGEVPDDYAAMPILFKKLSHLKPPGNICRVQFERFSPYFFDRDKYGLTLAPQDGYQFVFPKSRVNLSAIAYMFDGQWKGMTADPLDYTTEMRGAVDRWQENWKKPNRYFCYFEKGAEYLRIHDNRPRGLKDSEKRKVFVLDERLTAIYLFCDQNRSFQSILEMMRSKFSTGTDERAVRKLLDGLVAQWLMHCEEDRYLSLAVRKAGGPH